MSDASDNGTRHLAVIFFDVLVLDSVSLLTTPYSSRRSILESLIQTRPGHIMFAERIPIVFNGPGDIDRAGKQLRIIWSRIIAGCEEGLVLKADEGGYNDYCSPWVKVRLTCSFGEIFWSVNASTAQKRLYFWLWRYCRLGYRGCVMG